MMIRTEYIHGTPLIVNYPRANPLKANSHIRYNLPLSVSVSRSYSALSAVAGPVAIHLAAS